MFENILMELQLYGEAGKLYLKIAIQLKIARICFALALAIVEAAAITGKSNHGLGKRANGTKCFFCTHLIS